jgi:hypothetical protein
VAHVALLELLTDTGVGTMFVPDKVFVPDEVFVSDKVAQ